MGKWSQAPPASASTSPSHHPSSHHHTSLRRQLLKNTHPEDQSKLCELLGNPFATSTALLPPFAMSSASSDQALPTHRYQVVDVFNATHGGGNPLGVVIDARGWSDSAMQRFATWTNLVETTFLLPPSKEGSADYRVRIFTPSKEIPFAGHPSVGSAHAYLSTRQSQPPGDAVSSVAEGAECELQLVQECGAGLLKVAVDRSGGSACIYVQSPACRVIEQQPQEARRLLDIILSGQPLGTTPPAYLEGGRRWWLAEFATEAAVRAFQPDYPAIEALAAASQSLGLCIFARCSPASLVVRAFPLGAGIKEDPASGAANGLIASYLLMQVRSSRQHKRSL